MSADLRSRQEDEIATVRAAYREVFESDAGKVVLRDLYAFCGAMTPTAVLSDSLATFFNEGKRRVYLRVFSFVFRTPLDDWLGPHSEPPDPYLIYSENEQ